MEINANEIALTAQDQDDMRMPFPLVPIDCARDLLEVAEDELSLTRRAIDRISNRMPHPNTLKIVNSEYDRLSNRYDNLRIMLSNLAGIVAEKYVEDIVDHTRTA